MVPGKATVQSNQQQHQQQAPHLLVSPLNAAFPLTQVYHTPLAITKYLYLNMMSPLYELLHKHLHGQYTVIGVAAVPG